MFVRLTIGMIGVAVLLLVATGCGPAQKGPAIATQAGNSSPGDAARSACVNNLKQLGLGCKMYAAEHQSSFPDNIQALYPQYVADPNCFRCPSTQQAGGKVLDAPAMSDYEIVAGFTEKSPAKTVLIREKNTANHTPAGRNVLHVDGSAEFLEGAQ